MEYTVKFKYAVGQRVALRVGSAEQHLSWVVVGHKAMWHEQGLGLKYVIATCIGPRRFTEEVSEIELQGVG